MVGFSAPTLVATAVGVIEPSWLLVLVVAFAAFVVLMHHHLNRLVVEHAAATLENRQLAEQLALALDNEDRVTGVANRLGFERWLRSDGQQSLIVDIIDVERLDQSRWLYGHDGVDEMLASFARDIRSRISDDDLLARLTDRRFVVARPDAGGLTPATIPVDEVRPSRSVDVVTIARLATTGDAALADIEAIVTDLGDPHGGPTTSGGT